MKQLSLMSLFIITLITFNSQVSYGRFSYNIDRFTQVGGASGSETFIDEFEDDIEPPSVPSGTGTYGVSNTLSTNAESGGFLRLNSLDAVSYGTGMLIDVFLNDNTHFFNPGSGGRVDAKFSFPNGIPTKTGFGIAITTLDSGGMNDTNDAAQLDIDMDPSGNIIASYGSEVFGKITALGQQNISNNLIGITDITLRLEIDTANVVTASIDIGSNGTFDLTVPGSHTLSFFPGESYTGMFDAWSTGIAKAMMTGDVDGSGKDDIVVDFGGSIGTRIKIDNNTWVPLNTLPLEILEIGDIDGSGKDDIIADFGSLGTRVQIDNNTWVPLHTLSPRNVTVGDIDGGGLDEIILDFGDPYGIWTRMNNSTWVQLHTLSPETMTIGDIDGNGKCDIIVDFGDPYGIWTRMNNSTWVQLHTLSPETMTIGDIDGDGKCDLIVDFGDPYGTWIRMNNSTWVQLHTLSPETMTTGDIDGGGLDEIILDFGDLGIWARMNNSSWSALSSP